MSDIIVGDKIDCATDLLNPTDISPLQCIGNSLDIINANYDLLRANDGAICSSLHSAITAIESIVTPPLGTILMWNGTVVNSSNVVISNAANIVTNGEYYIKEHNKGVNPGAVNRQWALCTGKTFSGIVTPNLIGRFIVGAGRKPALSDTFNDTSSNAYNIGSSGWGGSELHKLTIPEMPRHDHGLSAGKSLVTSVSLNPVTVTYRPGTRELHGNILKAETSLNVSSSTISLGSYEGSSAFHENRPPYYALYYIMRIA